MKCWLGECIVCNKKMIVMILICRYLPFFDEHPFRIYEKILSDRAEFPRIMESYAK